MWAFFGLRNGAWGSSDSRSAVGADRLVSLELWGWGRNGVLMRSGDGRGRVWMLDRHVDLESEFLRSF